MKHSLAILAVLLLVAADAFAQDNPGTVAPPPKAAPTAPGTGSAAAAAHGARAGTGSANARDAPGRTPTPRPRPPRSFHAPPAGATASRNTTSCFASRKKWAPQPLMGCLFNHCNHSHHAPLGQKQKFPSPNGAKCDSPGQSVAAQPRRAALGSKVPQDPSPRRGTTRPRTGCAHDHCETAVNGWARFAGFDGENECQRIGYVPRDVGIGTFSTHGFANFLTRSLRLSRPFRATDVRGWPFTQGGAPRLRRVALPWANLFCPFGA